MSATILINGREATIKDGEWASADPALLAEIAAIELPQYLPDGVQAREAIKQLGGTLVAESDPDDESDLDDEGLPTIH